jgi:hypothetical protein
VWGADGRGYGNALEIPSPERRFRAERILGRIRVLRHAGSILAMQARRKA